MSGFSEKVRGTAMALAMAGAGGLAFADAAEAQSSRDGTSIGSGRAVVILANGTAFDWHRKKARAATDEAKQSDDPPLTMRTRLGSGSFVCSPAGFGRRSHCFSR